MENSPKLTAKVPENRPSQKERIVNHQFESFCKLLVSGRVIISALAVIWTIKLYSKIWSERMSLKVFKDLDTSKQYKSGTRSFSWQKLGAPEMETHCRSFQKSIKKNCAKKKSWKESIPGILLTNHCQLSLKRHTWYSSIIHPESLLHPTRDNSENITRIGSNQPFLSHRRKCGGGFFNAFATA